MAKALVTQELVTTIADELYAAGVEPTILTVQERIGAGSYTTVKRYLDQWKAQQAQRPAVEVPPEIAAKATVAVQAIWSAAVAQADQRVQEVEAEAQQQRATLQAQLQQAEQVIQRQERTVEDLSRQLAEAQQQLTVSQQEAREARTAVQVVDTRAADQARRIEELQATAAAATERAQQATTAQARLEGEAAALRQQVEALLGRLGGELSSS
jgi:septal ring factor EnvC (AmiA/AmiB activator)